MYPILVSFGGWQVHSYGVALAVAFLVGVGLAMREAHLAGEDSQRILDLAFYAAVASVAGAKLGWIATHLDAYRQAGPLGWLRVWEGGVSFPAGLLAAVLVAGLYLARHRLAVWRVADMAAPAVTAGLAIAELGCLAAGCNHGRPTHLPIGIVFTDPRGAAPVGVPLHPTQVYGAAWALVLLAALLIVRRRARATGPLRAGQAALLAAAGLGLGDFAVEFFRGDPRPMLAGGLVSASQPALLVVGAAALVLWWRRRPRTGRAKSATTGKGGRARRRAKGGGPLSAG